MSALPLLQLMTRKGCCLCDDAYIVADLAVRNNLCRFEVVDIDLDEQLKQQYGHDVPVLLINGVEFVRYFVEYPQLEQKLMELNNLN